MHSKNQTEFEFSSWLLLDSKNGKEKTKSQLGEEGDLME